MAAFATYLIAGLLTLLPILWLMLGAWMRVLAIATEYGSMVGSCVLIIAAYLTLFERRTAAIFALIGVICTLPFWTIQSAKLFVTNSFSPFLIACAVLYLLLVCVCGWRIERDIRNHEQGPGCTIPQRNAVLSISAICFALYCAVDFWQFYKNQRHPSEYLLPDGYVGWVVIHYGQRGAPPLPIVGEDVLLNIPKTGELQTSSQEEFGEAQDHYYYKLPDGTLYALPENRWGKHGMMWADSSGIFEGANGSEDHIEQFFIGTESQYNRMQKLPEMQEGVVTGDLRDKLP
jgi:hypothetical protein